MAPNAPSYLQSSPQTGRFILAAPEYVGGFEFNGVILAGVDEGRVPRMSGNITGEGQHFVRYAAHNLLYVAVTRAKYELLILASAERSLSEIPCSSAGCRIAGDGREVAQNTSLR